MCVRFFLSPCCSLSLSLSPSGMKALVRWIAHLLFYETYSDEKQFSFF